MCRLTLWSLCGLIFLAPGAVFGGSSKTSAIDEYCSRVRAEFASTAPFVFSGPDPWVQLDEVPASMPGEGLAFVYTAGADIRWVFVRVTDRDNGWSEDIDYFYRGDGTLAERERHLQSIASNIALDVTSYYFEGRLIKERAHHHPLTHRKTDSSRFSDPDAPTFWTIDDLPFPEIDAIWKRLA